MSVIAREIARSRCVTAYGLIGSLVDQLVEGWPLGDALLAEQDSDRDVVISEGDKALRAIDAFAQQFGIDVEAPA
jgi:hypothetical protein